VHRGDDVDALAEGAADDVRFATLHSASMQISALPDYRALFYSSSHVYSDFATHRSFSNADPDECISSLNERYEWDQDLFTLSKGYDEFQPNDLEGEDPCHVFLS
jgi:hypothetical protein